jgi:plastocyanin
MQRRTMILAAGSALAASLSARAHGRTHTVRIEGMQFVPATLSVHAGEHVTWHNLDVVPHTATAAGRFDSGAIAAGQSWTQTAPPPGRYEVVCSFHPGMKALLVVQ